MWTGRTARRKSLGYRRLNATVLISLYLKRQHLHVRYVEDVLLSIFLLFSSLSNQSWLILALGLVVLLLLFHDLVLKRDLACVI